MKEWTHHTDLFFAVPDKQLFAIMNGSSVGFYDYGYEGLDPNTKFVGVSSLTFSEDETKNMIYEELERFRKHPKECLYQIFDGVSSRVEFTADGVCAFVEAYQESEFEFQYNKLSPELQRMVTKVSIRTRAWKRRDRRRKYKLYKKV